MVFLLLSAINAGRRENDIGSVKRLLVGRGDRLQERFLYVGASLPDHRYATAAMVLFNHRAMILLQCEENRIDINEVIMMGR
jgi:2-hydroxy-3-keto-5-methylthiopentenyl-1-phosphate phosphatase